MQLSPRISEYVYGSMLEGVGTGYQGHASKEAIVMNEAVSRPIALQDEEAEQEKTNKQTNNTTSYNWHNKNAITHLRDTYILRRACPISSKLIA